MTIKVCSTTDDLDAMALALQGRGKLVKINRMIIARVLVDFGRLYTHAEQTTGIVLEDTKS